MFEFNLPDLGEGVAEGEVLTWRVSPGDAVTEDQVLAEVETDKAAVDVPSPVDGVVQELHAEVGEMVQTGEVLITIAEEGDAETADAAASDTDEAESAGGDTEEADSAASEAAAADEQSGASTSTADGRVFASPSVRRLAREEGVDIAAVDGSGPGGRVTEGDVEAATASADEATASDDSPTSVVSKASGDGDSPTAAVSQVDAGDTDDGTAVKSAVKSVSGDGQEAASRDQTLATPATRKAARELDVNIDAVPTDQTRDGQPYVDEAAVRTYAEAQQAAQAADAEAISAEGGATGRAAKAGGTGAVETGDGERREPYRGVRRSIGEQMARSRREVPHATHHDQVVVSGLVEARERLAPLAEERDVTLTYTPFVVKCVAAALDKHPVLNTALDTENEEIVYRDAHNIGVAAATDHGLVVPVVNDVDGKGLVELAGEVNDLVGRARERDIERSEMQGGTFTVTNFGVIGGEYASPIINVPETAILGIGALKERPVAEDGEVVAKPTLPLSLAIDHRVIDGADAARFVNTLKEYLSDPTRLLLE
ncbi:pyruvate dehydrogenase E2 component (dihydrolipoamide acetyltransferase) [Haloarcula quadrata]|uniref:Pyruvate dehydrogenase E2 component (Dihydrolipoamide acetyltransferase) n=1 Tax=Haloarcula quadrata TaxID=182779 RepID=A0A495R1D3_9EURY|nr:dihydrolipoamide acetyltransferase family protein [Haloarcula quadrata]RKS80944.1 pyruvate dehydrogenase E2 component (dihydrolipoamide acetyltransferase) [Haloarcula quadrata]